MEKLAWPMLPYIFALIVSISVWVLVWMRRHTGGASALLWFIFAGNLFALLIALEVVSATVNLKLMWGNIRFIVTAFAPFSLLYFSYTFTQRRLNFPKIWWFFLLAWPTIFTILLITDQYHELIYPPGAITLVAENALLGYKIPLAPMLLIYHSLAIAVFSIFLIIQHFFAVRRIFRLQIVTLLIGIFLPLIGIILSLLRIKLFDRWEPSFFMSITGNLILVWGLYRYQLFDIVPIAREVLIEGIRDGVLVLDEQLRVIDINPIASAYLNLDDMDVIGNDISTLLPIEKNELQKLTDDSFFLEIRLANGDEKRALEIKGVQLEDVSGNATGRLLVLYDITEKNRAKQELEAANEQLVGLNTSLQKANNKLEKLSRAKDEFVANISHELRSPLNNIRLNHDLLSLRPESTEKRLDVLRRETERLTILIEDLLMVSRIEQQQTQPQKSPFDL
ncbi:MAG: PAS domain-containing protein, partial [Anaerolineales bacterium]|nr:PAS domain-containing protein [Anaerolineales bacterium]